MPERLSATRPPPAARSFPAASLSWTVIVLVVVPSATIVPGAASIVLVASDAVPAPTVQVTEPGVRPAAVASMSIWPASVFVTEREAMPAAAVAVPSPATVPLPETWAKVTTVELSAVTVFPAASCSVAVRVFVAPEPFEPEASRSMVVAAPWRMV